MDKTFDDLKRICNENERVDFYDKFFCITESVSTKQILALIESYERLQSKLDKAIAALEFYTSRAVYERLQPDGDLIYCNEIAEQALAEIRKKDE